MFSMFKAYLPVFRQDIGFGVVSVSKEDVKSNDSRKMISQTLKTIPTSSV